MTTHPTDAQLRAALTLVEKATAGPWIETCGILKHYVGSSDGEFGFSAQEMHPRDGHETNAHNDCAFIAAAREGWPAAVTALLEARAAMDAALARLLNMNAALGAAVQGGAAMKPRYILFPVNAETSTVNGSSGRRYDWTKFCWDASETTEFDGKPFKAPHPFTDGLLIDKHCQYLHVPYNFTQGGTIYRIRPHDSLWTGQKHHGRLIVQQRAVKRDERWYWEIELEGSTAPAPGPPEAPSATQAPSDVSQHSEGP